MKRTLIGIGIAVLCLPMVFVCWLMLSAHWPKMDALTTKLPMAMRRFVAWAIVGDSSDAPSSTNALRDANRAIFLVPLNGKAWSHLCGLEEGGSHPSKQDILTCQRAKELDEDFPYDNRLAIDLDNYGDHCGAEALYRKIISDSTGDISNTWESMAQAAIRCGDVKSAQEAYEAAVPYHQKRLRIPYAQAHRHADKNPASSESDDIEAEAIATDEEYISALADRQGNTEASRMACATIEPDAMKCNCQVSSSGEVRCTFSYPPAH